MSQKKPIVLWTLVRIASEWQFIIDIFALVQQFLHIFHIMRLRRNKKNCSDISLNMLLIPSSMEFWAKLFQVRLA